VGNFHVVTGLFCLAARGGAVVLLYISATHANKRISDAQTRAATLELEAAKLRQTTVGLELDLEKERALRVKCKRKFHGGE